MLMDIQLPDIDGIDGARRASATTRSLDAMPVLAVSASVMPDEQQRIMALGFDGFIAKPIILIKPVPGGACSAPAEGRAK